MRVLRIALVPVAAAALAVFAGCGGGGGDSTESSTTTTEQTAALSKQALISQGDAICAEVNSAIGSIGSSGSGTQTQTIQVAGLYTGMVESLKGLGEPEEKAGYDEFIAAAEKLATVEGKIKLDAEREDTEALGEAATEAAPVLEEFQSAASAYGFQKCGEGPTAPSAAGSGGATPGGEEAPEASEEAEAAPEVEATPETGGEEPAPETGGTGTSPPSSEPGSNESGGIGPG
jgi:hypothetical protein